MLVRYYTDVTKKSNVSRMCKSIQCIKEFSFDTTVQGTKLPNTQWHHNFVESQNTEIIIFIQI